MFLLMVIVIWAASATRILFDGNIQLEGRELKAHAQGACDTSPFRPPFTCAKVYPFLEGANGLTASELRLDMYDTYMRFLTNVTDTTAVMVADFWQDVTACELRIPYFSCNANAVYRLLSSSLSDSSGVGLAKCFATRKAVACVCEIPTTGSPSASPTYAL